MNLALVVLLTVISASGASAQPNSPSYETVISGREATRIAELMFVEDRKEGTVAGGKAEIHCLKKHEDLDYVCQVKVFEVDSSQR